MDYCSACREQATRTPVTAASNVVWMTLRLTLTLLLMAGGPLPAGSYPHGPPHEACWDMQPDHGSEAQPTRTSPYELILTPGVHTYKQHKEVRVRIEGTTFVGFMLQARRVNSASVEPVGHFELPPTYSKHLHCLHSGDTVTHANRGPKWNMEFSWRPPKHNKGPVYFIATVVFRWDTYWMNVTSQVLEPRDYPIPETEPPTTTISSTTSTTTIASSSTSTTTLPTRWPSHIWELPTSPNTKTLRVSMTTPNNLHDDDDVRSTTMTARPIIIDEDQFPLISAAQSWRRSCGVTIFMTSLLISCSICWLFSISAGPRVTS